MNKLIAYVGNWLAKDETITCSVEDIVWSLKSFYPIPTGMTNESPNGAGCVMLTNRRLILLEGNNATAAPRWYSVTHILSLSERPPLWNKNWPYQAQLILGDGKLLVLETPKDNAEQRGKSLSALVVQALLSLGAGQPSAGLLAMYTASNEGDKKARREEAMDAPDTD
jgi:hypothetical protein